jgi:hypothetical protein
MGGWAGGWVGGWMGWTSRGFLTSTADVVKQTNLLTSAVRSNAYGGTPDGSGLPAMVVSYTRSE